MRSGVKRGTVERGVGGVQQAGRQRHAVQIGAAQQLLRLPVDQFCTAVDTSEVLAVPCTKHFQHEKKKKSETELTASVLKKKIQNPQEIKRGQNCPVSSN